MKKILRWFLCHIMNDHEWTCKASEGIEPDAIQLAAGIRGFKDYAKMYCKHCRTEPKLNSRL